MLFAYTFFMYGILFISLNEIHYPLNFILREGNNNLISFRLQFSNQRFDFSFKLCG